MKQGIPSGLNLYLSCLIFTFSSAATTPAACGQSISHIVPAAILPDQPTDVTIYGSALTEATRLWTSFEAEVQLAPNIKGNGKSANKITYRITPKKKTEVGIGAIRIATKHGVSNFKLICIDDLKSKTDNGKNHTQKDAQKITLGSAIDGQADTLKADYYQIKVKAGQRLTVDVLAGRLGTSLDPMIKLLDSKGQELAYSDDAPGVGNDARLKFQVKKEGSYYIKLRDMQYRGGVAYRYRMRVGYFPLVTGTFPLASRADNTTRVVALGHLLDPIASKKVTIPGHMFAGALPLSMKYPQGIGSGFVSLKISQQTEVVESEPNNTSNTSNRIPLPVAINGRFEKKGDVDYYQFIARKGQRLIFTGKTRSHRSPTQLFLQLYNSEGKLLITEEDNGKSEGEIDFKVDVAGTYQLKVSELLNRGGGAQSYRIEVKGYQPQISLSVDTTKVLVSPGGYCSLKVKVTRNDYQGPIKLLVAGAGSSGGFTVYNDTIAAGKNETNLTLGAPAKFKVGQLHHINIIGTASSGNFNLIETATTRSALKKQMPQTSPPEILNGAIGLAVIGIQKPLFQIKLEKKEILHPRVINQSSFIVDVTRLQKNIQSPLQILLKDLPASLKATIKPVDKGKNKYLVKLSGSVPKEHMLKLVAIGVNQTQTQVVELNQIPIRAVEPIEVKLSLTGAIKRGGTLKITAKIIRHGTLPAPLTLRLQNLPKAITAKEKYIVTAKQNEIEIELKASKDAQLGEYKNVLVTTTTKINKNDCTTKSMPVIIKVVQ